MLTFYLKMHRQGDENQGWGWVPSGRVPICTVTSVGFAVGAGASQSLTLAPLHASHALFWGAWSRVGAPPGSSAQSISTDLCHSRTQNPGEFNLGQKKSGFSGSPNEPLVSVFRKN